MDIIVEATVVSATVYPDRARVVARGRCDLPEGSHRIIIGDLPLALDPDSVRATGSGTARVRLRGVDVVRRHYADAPSKAVLALEKQIATLEEQHQALKDKQDVGHGSIDHLNGLRAATTEYAWGLARGRNTAENQAALMRFFEEEDGRLRGQLRELAAGERDLLNEIDKLKRELNELRSALPRQRFEAQMEIQAQSPGTFEPEISYVISGSGWQPLYDIQLVDGGAGNGGEATVVFNSLANIHQNSGQAWSQVELSVSTARPALNQVVPELKPWYIDIPRTQPRPLRGSAKMAMEQTYAESAALESMPMMAVMADAVPIVAEIDVAEIAESGTTVSYRVSGGNDIPGDGSSHKTALGRHEFTPQLDYLAIPRHTNAVYRRAKIMNSTAAPILPGSANLYVGDEYIGRNHLKYTPPAAELELVLGVEERIAVKRELVRREVDKRLLRDTRQVLFSYEIDVENLLNTSVKLTIRDQYPVSRHEQIKVRLDQVTPQPGEQSDLHILEWQMMLNTGQKEKIRFAYQIEYPRDLQIAGLID